MHKVKRRVLHFGTFLCVPDKDWSRAVPVRKIAVYDRRMIRRDRRRNSVAA